MASLSVSGLVPMSAAIAGSDVAITVESMFSMKRAVATMSGIRRCLLVKELARRFIIPSLIQPIADGGRPPRSCATPVFADLVSRFRSSHHFAAGSFAGFGIEGH